MKSVRSGGETKTEARANINSISDSTSLIPKDFLCPEISFLHETRGKTFVSVLYRLLRPQFPPTNFLNEHLTSMILDQDDAEDCVKIATLLSSK